MKTYRIFVSHCWNYNDQYEKILEFLDNGGISYYNHSVPNDDPIHTNGSDKELEEAIEAKVIGCSCVIILAGVYASYSKWIDKEIKMAQKHNKPIIGVRYWGALRISEKVSDAAEVIAGWNYSSVADAVRQYAL